MEEFCDILHKNEPQFILAAATLLENFHYYTIFYVPTNKLTIRLEDAHLATLTCYTGHEISHLCVRRI